MPPKLKYSKELIEQTAKALVERDGIECLSHRSIAKELGCSTQPIMSNFSTMDDVRLAVRKLADQEISEHVQKGMAEHKYPMDGAIFAYIEYASMHPNLFLFLVLDGRNQAHGPLLLTKLDSKPLIGDLATSTNLNAEGLRRLYTHCWFFAQGIATTIATGVNQMSMEEIEQYVFTSAQGTAAKLREQGYRAQ